MNLHRLGRAAAFVAGSIVGGLALAFVIVFLRPQLLQRASATLPANAAPNPAPVQDSRSASSAAPPAGNDVAAPASSDAARDAGARGGNASSAPPPTESYAAAVMRAAPAVVNISTQRLVTEQFQPSVFDQMFGDLQPFYRHRVERALGSGVIVDSAGHIITNNHVIANAETINVGLADNRVAPATVVGRDPDTDLALLSIKLKNLPVMPLGRSDEIQVGDVVLAIGDPLGLSQTVTHGIVSATGREQLGIATFEDFIQTDAAINFGNSGGALIDTTGALVGINTAIPAKNLGVEGIGFAIPVNLVRGVLNDIVDHGRVVRGWIGIVPEDVTDAQAQQLGLPRGGVVVSNLYVGSPSQQAGLQPGDVLVSFDGAPLRSAQEALASIAARKPGTSVAIHVLRGRQSLDLHAHVSEAPQNRPGQG
jgi:serine protease DegS